MKIKAYVPIIGPHLLKNYILYPAYMPSPSQQVGPTTHLLWGRWHTCQIHDITSSFVLMITTIVEIEPRMMFLIFWRLLIFEKTVVNFLFYILYVGCTWQWHPLDSSTVHTHLSKLIYEPDPKVFKAIFLIYWEMTKDFRKMTIASYPQTFEDIYIYIYIYNILFPFLSLI